MNVNAYPSRMYIRCLARTQLLADLSDIAIPLCVNRGGANYTYMAIPGGECPTRVDRSGGGNPMDVQLTVRPYRKTRTASNNSQSNSPTSEQQVELATDIDNDLLADITSRVFGSKANLHIYQEYTSEPDARQVEEDIAKVIIGIYRQIKENAVSSIVQALNASYNR
jgi:hypothetical protein